MFAQTHYRLYAVECYLLPIHGLRSIACRMAPDRSILATKSKLNVHRINKMKHQCNSIYPLFCPDVFVQFVLFGVFETLEKRAISKIDLQLLSLAHVGKCSFKLCSTHATCVLSFLFHNIFFTMNEAYNFECIKGRNVYFCSL